MTAGELIEILEAYPRNAELEASHGSTILYVQDKTGRPRAAVTFGREMPKCIYQDDCIMYLSDTC